MGIYSNSYVGQPSDYGYDETLDSIMLDESVKPCESDDLIAESYDIIYTMEENYNMLFTTLGINELRSIEEEEQRFVYTEGFFQNIFNKVKDFMKKIWNRIKSLFKKFMIIFDGYRKSDKDFVNKYRRQIFTYKNLDDFTFKGYKWNINKNDIDLLMSSMRSQTKDAMDRMNDTNYRGSWLQGNYVDYLKEHFEEEFDKIRYEIINRINKNITSKKLTLSEFKEELELFFKSGNKDKEELDKSDLNISEMANYLLNSRDQQNITSKIFKDNKKLLDNLEKRVESERKFSEEMSKSTDPTLGKVARIGSGPLMDNTDNTEVTYRAIWTAPRVLVNRDAAKQYKLGNNPQYDSLAVEMDVDNIRGWLKDNHNQYSMLNADPVIQRHIKDKNWLEVKYENIERMPDDQINYIKNNSFGLKTNMMTLGGVDPNIAIRSYKTGREKMVIPPKTKYDFSIIHDPSKIHFGEYSDGLQRETPKEVTEAEWHKQRLRLIEVVPRYITAISQLLINTDSITLDAMKTCSRQYKACLVKYITYKPKKEDTEFLTESSDLIYDNEKPLYREPFDNFNHIENIRIV